MESIIMDDTGNSYRVKPDGLAYSIDNSFGDQPVVYKLKADATARNKINLKQVSDPFNGYYNRG
jgi:hypothetical protein